MTAARRVVGQVGIDVPARLPGGVWGAPALTYRMVWSSPNGVPSVSFRPGTSPLTLATSDVQVPSDVAARDAARAEQPWPQAWVAQVGVSATAASPQPLTSPPEIEYEVLLGVESASFALRFGVPWTGQKTEILPFSYGSAQAIQFVAQQLQVRPILLRGVAPDPVLSGFQVDVSITWLLGLASPPQVVQP